MRFSKKTRTAVAALCLTAFAASVDAAPRAVTVPRFERGSAITAAAKVIKKEAEKKSAKAEKSKKPAAVISEAELPKNYKKIKIHGKAEATKEQAAALIYLTNADPQLNCSVDEIVDLYWEEAGREGVRQDLALAQALIETGFFSFTGDVKPEQNNFCGLGTTGNGVEGAYFEKPAAGVRAHIQHLLAYSTKRKPETKIIDPRYEMAHKIRLERGLCETWYKLNGTWAMGSHYCEKIMRVYSKMLALDEDDLKQAQEAREQYLAKYVKKSGAKKKDKEKAAELEQQEHKPTMRERVEKILKEGK